MMVAITAQVRRGSRAASQLRTVQVQTLQIDANEAINLQHIWFEPKKLRRDVIALERQHASSTTRDLLFRDGREHFPLLCSAVDAQELDDVLREKALRLLIELRHHDEPQVLARLLGLPATEGERLRSAAARFLVHLADARSSNA